MSQYQKAAKGAPSPALSGTTEPQQSDPASLRGTEQPQGAEGNEEQYTERNSESLDISKAIREMQQSVCQLHSTLHGNNQSEAATPYQQASIGVVLTKIADDIAECLHWLRKMCARDEADARPEQPALHSGMVNNTTPVLQREDAITGDQQTVLYPASGVLPTDGLRDVAPPPPVFQTAEPYGAAAEAGQLLQGDRGGYVYLPHPNINPHTWPHVQSHMSLPPTPGLYQNQWVQSPPVSPLIPASFCQNHNHHHRYPLINPATIPEPAVVPPPPTHQRQPLFPQPGTGVTMSLPLHYDTPAGPRTTLYHSHFPGHLSGPSTAPEPVSRQPGMRQEAPAVSPAAAAQEMAADTPPPSLVSAGPDGHPSSARASEWFARVHSDDDDSEDGLDSPGAELIWSGVFDGTWSS